jgi:choline dehydrogenase-like flavoprotein
VVDGSAVTANVGVNASLTITAMAERAMSRVEKGGSGGLETRLVNSTQSFQ